ncbi:hypothetical protein ANN_00173 [Periplaneta americana]|uniref:FLYWCH-type domain-containing protein n=1 Tax=Periplaneta americana TaxID=6978 RepID=A0ABQ8TQ78_PERAM|nr:hypothetical protein ANN_00173 [Periplaneta americana]
MVSLCEGGNEPPGSLKTSEQASITAFINAFVHIFMYTYYMLSAMGPRVKKYLWWKKYITLLQLKRSKKSNLEAVNYIGTMGEEIRFTKSERGSDKLIYLGYMYTRLRENKNGVVWRCDMRGGVMQQSRYQKMEAVSSKNRLNTRIILQTGVGLRQRNV